MKLSDLLEQWGLIEFDFATILHVDLVDNLSRPWRWFMVRVRGLLAHPDSQLRAHFADREDLDG